LARGFDDLFDVQEYQFTIYRIISERHTADGKSDAELSALAAAIKALEEQRGDTVEGRILQYHVNKPAALLFRDQNTMRALKAGFSALKRKEEELQRRCRQTDL